MLDKAPLTFSIMSVMWVTIGYLGSVSNIINLTECLSYTMIMLTMWLFISYSIHLIKEKKLYQTMVMLYFPLLAVFFSTDNIFMFYIMFEMSILPIFLIILGWGNQPERLMASNYLLVYTLLFSFPLMIIILLTVNFHNSFNWQFLEIEPFIWILLMLPFFIKIPIFLLHLWLPKAHVEAPVLGSMILASILLKVGGYGMLKVYFLYEFFADKISISLILILILMSSTLCLLQTDLKKFVAYSSVTHMTMLLALLVMDYVHFENSSIFLMISHGVISNSLFFLVGMLSYTSTSRLLYKQNNVMTTCSVLWYWSMIILFLNTGTPPSLGMMSEITLFITSHLVWFWNFMICLSMFFFLLYYPVWMMCNMNSNMNNFNDNMIVSFSDLLLLTYLPLATLLAWSNPMILL
uniref:NADH-ubiquinone oxidoreductase chain 4 n=2 Tax=Trichuris TaxID=36086 RepID=A0A891GS82_TRITR|nr:NADH dehydrogenase subunit 4 [Trichuris sp. TTB1]QRK25847.1 NADH dehydrogenase subunit 4 [Trichuris trichiura]QRK25873.1 NADH dehydrogenase subunit 4 [Trichuris trichiura]